MVIMKKSLLFMMTLGAMIMVSCSKNNVPAASPEINLNIKISGPGAETKAAKKSCRATGEGRRGAGGSERPENSMLWSFQRRAGGSPGPTAKPLTRARRRRNPC